MKQRMHQNSYYHNKNNKLVELKDRMNLKHKIQNYKSKDCQMTSKAKQSKDEYVLHNMLFLLLIRSRSEQLVLQTFRD